MKADSFIYVIILVLLPFVVKFSTLKFKKFSPSTICLISSILVYGVTLVFVKISDFRLKNNLKKYDLNGDGIYSEHEITAEYTKAALAYTSDTGRQLAPITGIVFSFLYFLIAWAVFHFIILFKSCLNKYIYSKSVY